MRLRHLRYFLVVAEEQSLSRAAAKVHIDPSPLSRAIRDLEAQLGVQLFHRARGSMHLTLPGEIFYEEARRMLSLMENARLRVRSAADGYRGRIRIGLADGLAQPNLTRLLALSREEEPSTEIRISELTVSDLMQSLRLGDIDVGFTMDGEVVDGLRKEIAWQERLVLATPIRHPILSLDRIILSEILRYPLIVCHPEQCTGGYKTFQQWLYDQHMPPPIIAEYASGHESMLMLVAAGYGIGIGLESQISHYNYPDVVIRPTLEDAPMTTAFIVSATELSSPALGRFLARVRQIGENTSMKLPQQ